MKAKLERALLALLLRSPRAGGRRVLPLAMQRRLLASLGEAAGELPGAVHAGNAPNLAREGFLLRLRLLRALGM